MMNIDDVIAREKRIYEENQKVIDTHVLHEDFTLEELYCDDTEVIEEHLNNYRFASEYHKQIAEWLEELKALQHFESNYEHNLKVEYNKGIDDFYDEVLNFEDYIEPLDTSKFGAVLLYSGVDITKMIYNIKEQLKADGE